MSRQIVGRMVVIKPSSNGTFQEGDHISLYENGDMGCREAGGWIVKEEVESAMAGCEVRPDTEYYKRRAARLREELEQLQGDS